MLSPIIPDNTYKFLLYLGLVILGFSIYQDNEEVGKFNTQLDVNNMYIDSISIRIMYLEEERQQLLSVSDDLSKKYSISNPITVKDSLMIFTYSSPPGSKEEFLVADTLRSLWKQYRKADFEINILNKKRELGQEKLKTDDASLTILRIGHAVIFILGLAISSLGYFGMRKYQDLQERLTEIAIFQSERKYGSCQSCGRNFSSVVKYGHESDGSLNFAFCSDCYKDGEFTEPDLTWNDFIKKKMLFIKSKKNIFQRNRLFDKFKNLDRWNKDQYS